MYPCIYVYTSVHVRESVRVSVYMCAQVCIPVYIRVCIIVYVSVYVYIYGCSFERFCIRVSNSILNLDLVSNSIWDLDLFYSNLDFFEYIWVPGKYYFFGFARERPRAGFFNE